MDFKIRFNEESEEFRIQFGEFVDGGHVEEYDGTTEFTPSEQTQTAETAEKLVPEDITIEAIPSDYVGSSVPRRTQLNVSGDTVTAPAGFYENGASASVAHGSARTPDTTITADPTISVDESGLIEAGASASQSVTPVVAEGYVERGEAGTIRVTGGASRQLLTQQGKTVTPTEQEQEAVDKGRWTTGKVKVAGISPYYVGSSVPRRDDINTFGKTVVAPAGYYPESVTKDVQTGTEGTPIASKSAVSDHAVTVTPSVTNQGGWIDGGTRTGQGVRVQASELVSGSRTIEENGTYDVTNLASVTADIPAGDNVLVVTLSWDENWGDDGGWLPDKTFTEIQAAYQAEKLSTVQIDSHALPQGLYDASADGTMFPEEEPPCFYYVVHQSYEGSGWDEQQEILYCLYSAGVYLAGLFTYVVPMLQDKAVTPSTSQQTVTYDSGFNGLNEVIVEAIIPPSGNIELTQQSGTDVSAYATASVVDRSNVVYADIDDDYGGFITEGGVRMYLVRAFMSMDGRSGWVDGSHYYYGPDVKWGALPANTTVTPTNQSQSVGGQFLMMEGPVTINPIPSQYIVPSGNKAITQNGNNIDVAEYETVSVNVPSGQPNLQNKTKTYTPTETAQTEAVTADAGYDGLDEVDVTVAAIPSDYVGSGVDRRDSTDLTASGATVSVPAGYYENNASKAVASGSASPAANISGTQATLSTGNNTLTLTKRVANTPQVTPGYVGAGTQGNTDVTLTANVTTQGAQTIYPSLNDQTINSGRYLTGNQTIKGVTTSNLTAANIKAGVTVMVGDSADPDRVMSVTGTYEGSGGGGDGKNAQTVQSTSRVTSTSLTKASGDITVAKTGTYDVYWTTMRSSTSGTWSSRLYVGNTAQGAEQSTFSNHVQTVHLSNISLTAGQVVSVYAKSRGSNYYAYVPMLTIIES